MKILFSALLALSCLSANAAMPKLIKAGTRDSVRIMGASDFFFGPVAVGRISPMTFQVELTGLVVTDPEDGAAPYRTVKAVVNIAPEDPEDMDQFEDAMELISYFYSVKSGIASGGDCMDHCYEGPVAKVTSIVYNADSISRGDLCLGTDLQVADLGTPTDKYCYQVRPLEIIESSL